MNTIFISLFKNKPISFDHLKTCDYLRFWRKTEYWVLLLKENQMRNVTKLRICGYVVST